MFSKEITSSSEFLMMPHSTQNLYFHFGMNGDDDGFVEYFAIMRMVAGQPDDLKILKAKGYVHIFDDKVLWITHWKTNNFIRSDRYQASKYLSIYKEEIAMISANMVQDALGIPTGNRLSPQGRVGEGSVGIYNNNPVDSVDNSTREWRDGDTIQLKDCVAIRRYGEWVDKDSHVKLNRQHYTELPA